MISKGDGCLWISGTTACAACITSFPKMSKLQEEFKDDAVFLMVGLNDKKYNNGIEQLYAKLREQKKLKMPCAFDSVLVEKWRITAMPYMLVVDTSGIVRAITDGRNLNSTKNQKI